MMGEGLPDGREQPPPGEIQDLESLRASRAGEPRPKPPAPRRATSARAARLQELKEQIARGEYKPDPDEIARRLLDNGF